MKSTTWKGRSSSIVSTRSARTSSGVGEGESLTVNRYSFFPPPRGGRIKVRVFLLPSPRVRGEGQGEGDRFCCNIPSATPNKAKAFCSGKLKLFAQARTSLGFSVLILAAARDRM